MRYFFLILIAFLLLSCENTTQETGDNYRIIISNMVDGNCVNDTIHITANEDELDSISYFVFMKLITEYDFKYYNILNAPISKKLEIAYPYHYLTINSKGDTINQDTLLAAKSIHRRLENDYWGRMWYKSQGLKDPEYKRNEKSKKPRKADQIVPKHFDPVPSIGDYLKNHQELPNPPKF